MKRPLGLTLAAVMLLTTAAAASEPLEVTRTRDGVRITMKLDGPLVAGQPTRVRTRVTNTGDQPIWWHASSGIYVGASMPDARWRTGEPPVKLPAYGEPGFPARQDLKNDIVGGCGPRCDRIVLDFEVKRVNGKAVERPWNSDTFSAERFAPGGSIVFVHEWDGYARFEEDLAPVGLPPDGPVRISATTYFSPSRERQSRTLKATLETSVVGGRDDDLFHPFEVVDAALEDPAFADMMAARDFNRYDTGYITYVDQEARWYVGSCGRAEGDDVQNWHLAAVDPVSGEVLGFVEGEGDESCDPSTWPAASDTSALASDPESEETSTDEPEASEATIDEPAVARPVLGPALPMPDGRIPVVSTKRRPDATMEKQGIRLDAWVPTEAVASGDWLPAIVRVTNTSDQTILTNGDTKGWPYRLPMSTVLDLTGLFDPGANQTGMAKRFKDRFLDSPTVARLIMEQQPRRGDEFPDYGIRPRLRPGASFELPVVAVPRYAWRDQPLPGGTASVDVTFCFRRTSAEAGRREACIRASAPVAIEGEPVEYPGPAEIADAALSDPDFGDWVESRRPNVAFGINVAGIFPGDSEVPYRDLGSMGGPAPAETIQIRAGGGGPSPGSASVILDPWDVSVSAAPSESPTDVVDWGLGSHR